MPRFTHPAMRAHLPCTMFRRPRQAGGIALAMIATLLVVAATTLAIRMARQVEDRRERVTQTQARMERIRAALLAFAATQGRLPCPSDGALDEGLAVPPTAVDDCTNRDGTVPWVSLGLQSHDALDGWGQKISYRVPDGFNGLTRPSGVGSVGSMGLNVNDGATLLVNQAWVLISHGASGLGAWRVAAPRMAMPGAGGNEWSNTQAPPVNYFRREDAVVNAGTGNDYASNDVAHFDDVLLFESIAALEKQSSLEPLVVRLTQERLTTGNPSPVVFTGRNSSQSSIAFDSGTRLGPITVTAGGGSGTVSVNVDGTGIGVCSGACATDAESALDNSKSLGFKLSSGKTADKFALGVLSLEPTVEVSITYIKNSPPMPPTNLGTVDYPIPPASPLGASPGVIAVFENTQPNPPAAFDEVVIRPKGTSRFFIASIRFCTAAENCN